MCVSMRMVGAALYDEVPVEEAVIRSIAYDLNGKFHYDIVGGVAYARHMCMDCTSTHQGNTLREGAE